MSYFAPTLLGPLAVRAYAGLLLALLPSLTKAQSAEAPVIPRHIVSFSPAELFYKAQLGYEHRLGRYTSVGATGFHRYGFEGRYKGWQISLFGRYYLTSQFPVGLYLQAQANAFNHQYEANLINRQNYRQSLSFDYRGVGSGGGVGLGYQGRLLRRACGGRLLGNVLLGARAQLRPHYPAYDTAAYSPSYGFLGNDDDANWHLSASSPGSILYGLLTLAYQF
jgi:hypothetical protein